MARLINIDNGGTLTDFCVVDGERSGTPRPSPLRTT
jgi:N-methylhydantoinase A/oxoprolinase/acetone carboxylase beta subunit